MTGRSVRSGIDLGGTRAPSRDEDLGDLADHAAVCLEPVGVPIALEQRLGFRGQLSQFAIDTLVGRAYGPRRRGGAPWPE